MYNLISATIKTIEKWVRNLFAKLQKLIHIWKTQRGLLVCPIMHFVFTLASTIGAIPYGIKNLDNGFRTFTPVTGTRKWVTNLILFFIVLRGLFVFPVGFSSEMKWTVDGRLTADLLYWLIAVNIVAVFAVVCTKLLFDSEQIRIIYENFNHVTIAFARECMEGKHILECKGHKDPRIFYACAATGLSVICAPALTAAAVSALMNSPLSLAYVIIGPAKEDTHWLLLFWIYQLMEWVNLTYAIWILAMSMAGVSESMISAALLIREFRTTERISWAAKLRYHAQGELAVSMFNDFAAIALPVFVSLGLTIAATSFTMLIKMDLARGFPPVQMVPALMLLGMGAVVVGFMFLRFAAIFRDDSIAFLKEVEDEITIYYIARRQRYRNTERRVTGRLFRRRPMGLTFGSFMHIDAGLCITYVTQVFDNTVTLVYMTDLWSIPMWLI